VALTLHHHIATFHNSHCVYAHLLSNGRDYETCGRPCEAHRIALRDYDAQAQSAAPLVPHLLDLGVRRFRVELVWERAEEVTRTLVAYRKLLSGELGAEAVLKEAAVHERYGVTTPLRKRLTLQQ
jgi:putative protease